MAQALLMRAGGAVDLDFVTATASEIKKNYTGSDKEGEPVQGNIQNYNGEYTIINN